MLPVAIPIVYHLALRELFFSIQNHFFSFQLIFGSNKALNKLLDTSSFIKKYPLFCLYSNPSKLIKYAKICRVENVMRPYIESMI